MPRAECRTLCTVLVVQKPKCITPNPTFIAIWLSLFVRSYARCNTVDVIVSARRLCERIVSFLLSGRFYKPDQSLKIPYLHRSLY